MSTEDNKALIRRFFDEVVNKGNLDAFDEFDYSQFVGYFPGISTPLRGAEDVKHLVMLFRTAFPDLHDTIEDMIAEGDKVVARHTFRGTHQGEFQGIPPTSKQVTFSAIDIYRFAGDKLVEQWVSLDQLGLLQQLGVVPTMG